MGTQVQQPEPAAARDYKSRMFIMIFHDKKELLKLYNAVSGKCYDDPELLTINTLENAIYLSMKNDISFLIDSGLSLYEHQSTFNPNMPLRFLFYLSDLYSSAVKDKNLYGTRVVPVPAPRFIVFYNGREERPDRETIYLSDAYETKEAEVSLELKADIWNINRGHNKELMEACKTLQEYSEYVHRLRKNAEKFPIMDAVEKTIDECIRENILQEFLIKNRAEAKKVSIYEYNEEEHMRMEREDAFEDGLKAGIEKGREQLEAAEQRADTAEKRAEAAERRAAEAEAELRKIKEQLAVKK